MFRNMCKNFRTVFRYKRLKVLFWKIINTYSNSEFNKCVNGIKTTNFKIYEKLNTMGFKTFVKSQFSVPRYSKTTSNPVESKNSTVKKFIALDITNLIISFNNYAMKWFYGKK